MTGRISVMLMLGSALALGACTEKSAHWDRDETTHPNTVELLRIPHDVQFASDMTALTAQEIARLDGFLKTVKPGAGDMIVLDAAADGDNPRIAEARADSLRRHLVKAGYRVADGTTPSGAAPAANSIRLVVEHAVVRTPNCPDWSQKAWPNYNNAPTSNYGCATETALGLMIANPRDLTTPATYEPINAENDAKAIQRMRDDKIKWTEKKGNSTMKITQ